jgi:hypothetical protein
MALNYCPQYPGAEKNQKISAVNIASLRYDSDLQFELDMYPPHGLFRNEFSQKEQ